MQRQLTTASVRSFVLSILLTDSEIDAFCLDYFPATKRRFSNGTDQTSKINTLLEREEHRDIVTFLQRDPRYASLATKYANFLRYESLWIRKFMSILYAIKDEVIIGKSPTPTKGSLRKLLEITLIDDTDVNTFCIDYFPKVKRQFSNNMDRQTKFSILLSDANPSDILLVLKESFKEKVAKHQHVLRYRWYNFRWLSIVLTLAFIVLGILWLVKQYIPTKQGIPDHKEAVFSTKKPAQVMTAKPFTGHSIKASQCWMVFGAVRNIPQGLSPDEYTQYYDYFPGIAMALGIEQKDSKSVWNLSGIEIMALSLSRISGLTNIRNRYIDVRYSKKWHDKIYGVDPKMIIWLRANVIQSHDAELRQCVQALYNETFVRAAARAALYSYHVGFKTTEVNELDKLLTGANTGQKATGLEVFVPRALNRKLAGVCAPKVITPNYNRKATICEHAKTLTYECAYIATGRSFCEFWSRRFLDGSHLIIANLLVDFVGEYDKEFYAENHVWLDAIKIRKDARITS